MLLQQSEASEQTEDGFGIVAKGRVFSKISYHMPLGEENARPGVGGKAAGSENKRIRSRPESRMRSGWEWWFRIKGERGEHEVGQGLRNQLLCHSRCVVRGPKRGSPALEYLGILAGPRTKSMGSLGL